MPVLSPMYFFSRNCCMEWATFRHRRAVAGADCLCPVRLSDGDYFPPEAQADQWLDFADFASVDVRSRASKGLKDRIGILSAEILAKLGACGSLDPALPVVHRDAFPRPPMRKPTV